MDTIKRKLEVLRLGESESLDILNENLMDMIIGGDIKCKKDYSLGDNGTIACGCSYKSVPTEDPDEEDGPTGDDCCDCCGDECDCNTDCPDGCNDCKNKGILV